MSLFILTMTHQNYLKTKLPTNLIDREKWGFGAPVDVWLQNELKPLLHSYLNKEAILNSGVFDPAFVNEKLKAFENGQVHEFKKIWSILVYQIWHENYCKF